MESVHQAVPHVIREERISYVIKALGVPEEYAPGTIRITLCGDTTRADVDAALVSLKRNIAILRG